MMSNKKVMERTKKITIILLASLFMIVMVASSKTSQVSSGITSTDDLEWTSDGSSLTGWSQCHGDATYENQLDYPWVIESYDDVFTPENKTDSTGYWDLNYDDDEIYRHAGIYREEPGLKASNWLLELTVSFDVENTNLYSFLGSLGILIDNANKDPMVNVYLWDGSAVGDAHSVAGRAGYYLTDGSYTTAISTSANSTHRNIENGTFAMKKNSSGIFVYYPEEIPDGSGWRLIADTTALQRGTPTYIHLYFSRRRLGPADARIENVTFSQGISWTSDGSSLIGWSQCHGDATYESQLEYPWEIESYDDAFTPENKTESTGYWDPNYDDDEIYRHAGIYREEPGLKASNWLLELTVSFDVENTNLYSFLGTLRIHIDNADKDPIVWAHLWDGSAVGTSHSVEGAAGYYFTNGSLTTTIDTNANSTDCNIDNGTFAMKRNSSGIFVYYPEEIPDGSGWRLIADDVTALQRGTPTYIHLYFSRRRLGPADARIENVTFTWGYSNEPPTIDSPNDISYEEGTTGHSITWTPADTDPATYNITHDGTLIKEGAWNSSGETITISVDGLSIGTYTYRCNVYDTDSQLAYDEVIVTVVNDLPTIDSPNDISYDEGTSGHSITWTPADTDPATYNITHDGTLIKEGAWNSSEETITISVDGLSVGTYTYRCNVYDTNSQLTYDEVIVTVLEAERVPSPPLNLTATASSNQVILTWAVPSDQGTSSIIEYRIYRSTYTGHYNYLESTTSLEFSDTTVSNGITYYYVVTAVNAYGESDYSEEVSVIPLAESSSSSSTTELSTDTSSTYESQPGVTSGFPFGMLILPLTFIILIKKKQFLRMF